MLRRWRSEPRGIEVQHSVLIYSITSKMVGPDCAFLIEPISIGGV